MIHKTAEVQSNIPNSCSVWQFSHIRENCKIGDNVIIGRNCYIDFEVGIGKNSKIQNNCLIYHPAIIGDNVFIGPAVVFTNDHNPRATDENGNIKSSNDWIPVGVTVLEGASIGANSVCVAPVKIGKWAMVGAGSVVTKNVPDFALVVGNPAKQIGWVNKQGHRLVEQNGFWVCPQTSKKYIEENGELISYE